MTYEQLRVGYLRKRLLISRGAQIRSAALIAMDALAIVAFGYIGSAKAHSLVARLDFIVFRYLALHRHPGVVIAMLAITVFGEEAVVFCAALLFGLLSYFRARRSNSIVLSVGVCACSIALNKIAKSFFMRTRPPLHDMVIPLTDPGFPSAHAMNATSVYGTLAYLAIRMQKSPPRHTGKLVLVSGLASFAIGISRIYLSEHWLSDVIGGWLCGGVLLSAAVLVDQRVMASELPR